MILIPEQISYLRSERERLIESIRSYRDYLQNKEIVSSDYSSRAIIGDTLTDEQFHRERKNLKEVTDLLSTSEYLKERQLEQIGIGTKFLINFDGSDEIETVILTDCIYGLTADNCFVSITSLLGENVFGKKAGDTFSYIVSPENSPWDKHNVSGSIIEIKQGPKDYIHYLTERPKTTRISNSAKRKLHFLLNDSSEESQRELSTYNTLTPSQMNILQLEEGRLQRKKDPSSIARLATVRKLLKKEVVTDIPENIISVGSKFDLAIKGPNQEVITGTYEMINSAVSDELEDYYIERISPLGVNIYGLTTNSTFKFIKNNKTYQGVVTAVHSTKKDIDELQPSYQYRKK